jgi:hypothetical protein
MYGFLSNQRLDRWTAIFLVTTVLTSLTGFLFPFTRVTPAGRESSENRQRQSVSHTSAVLNERYRLIAPPTSFLSFLTVSCSS